MQSDSWQPSNMWQVAELSEGFFDISSDEKAVARHPAVTRLVGVAIVNVNQIRQLSQSERLSHELARSDSRMLVYWHDLNLLYHNGLENVSICIFAFYVDCGKNKRCRPECLHQTVNQDSRRSRGWDAVLLSPPLAWTWCYNASSETGRHGWQNDDQCPECLGEW